MNYNSWRVLANALESLRAHPPTRADGSPMPYEAIVVDNASPQGDEEAERRVEQLVAQLGGALVRHGENSGYAQGMNLAFGRASGAYVLVSNPDVLFEPHCFERMLRYLEAHPEAGAVTPETFADRGLESRLPTGITPKLEDLVWLPLAAVSARVVRRYCDRRRPGFLRVWDAEGDIEMEMFAGWCFLIRRSVIDEVGFFDERYPLYFEDTDLSLRVLAAGHRIVQVCGAKIVHLYNRSGSTDPELAMQRWRTSRELFFRKWHGRFGGLVHALSTRFEGLSFTQRRARIPPYRDIAPADWDDGVPVVRLPRAYERFLVELAYDPYFFLAAGAFGRGERWSPSASMLAEMHSPVYVRVIDLSDGLGDELGVWQFDPAPARRRLASAGEVA